MRMNGRNRRSRIMADEELDMEVEQTAGGVNVDDSATDLLFEAEDVAELVAEVTGEVVEVTADGDEVTFAVGQGENAEEFTVSADGDEEVLESVRRPFRGKRTVSASRRVGARRRVAASTSPVKGRKTVRKVPSSRRYR